MYVKIGAVYKFNNFNNKLLTKTAFFGIILIEREWHRNYYFFMEDYIMNSDEKVFGILAYIGILCLVPVFAGKSEFSKFHANQGLILFIVEVITGVLSIILGFIPVIGLIIGFVLWAVDVVCIVFAIMGIVAAAQGQMKPLPLIGNIKILK